jgi:hypothetical protein
MNKSHILMARSVAVFVTVAGGSLAQIALWKDAEMTFFDALTKNSWIWIPYLLVGLLIGEHTVRWLKKVE